MRSVLSSSTHPIFDTRVTPTKLQVDGLDEVFGTHKTIHTEYQANSGNNSRRTTDISTAASATSHGGSEKTKHNVPAYLQCRITGLGVADWSHNGTS
jgi:hypothetical protein